MKQLMMLSGYLTEEDDPGSMENPSEEEGTSPEAGASESVSAQPVYSPNCQWLEESSLGLESLSLANGTSLQIGAVPPGVLNKADLAYFYCCTQCGKVFWEGSHFGRVVSQFRDVLGATKGSQSFYELS
uniref:Mut7-C RNAse domain-containing protein n=1 Tax=Sphenodon punctatus TaxID=8508 RepID=A0A8D0GUN3_SPHPU